MRIAGPFIDHPQLNAALDRWIQEYNQQHQQTCGTLLVFDDDVHVQQQQQQQQQQLQEPSLCEQQLLIFDNDNDEANKKRTDVIDEIIATEKTYVEGLDILMKEYIEPIKDFIDKNMSNRILLEFQNMFSSLNIIQKVNEHLLQNLQQMRNNHAQQVECIGHLFQQISPMFKTYSIFINNYNRIQNRVTEILNSNFKLSQFVREKEAQLFEQNKNTLMQYLITPAQRLTRYHLLLRVC
jgi:hypothetical protein